MTIAQKFLIPVLISVFLGGGVLFYQTHTFQKDFVSDITDKGTLFLTAQYNDRRDSEVMMQNSLIAFVTKVVYSDSSHLLLTYEKENLRDILTGYMKQVDLLAGIVVYDTIEESNFIALEKKDGRILSFEGEIPAAFGGYLKQSVKISTDDNTIGELTLYFNTKLLNERMEKVQSTSQNYIKQLADDAKTNLTDSFYTQIIYISAIFFIIVLIVWWIAHTVILSPLQKFKKGLEGFFDFLQNKSQKTEPIVFSSGDEIGTMVKSVNENIEVSAKLHAEINDLNRDLENKVQERTKKISELLKDIRDSIDYASLIQYAILPQDALFERHFSNYFVIWQPRDTVSGDIYLLESLRHEDECLFFIVDCTGHGIPGAFVTMLVKAIERSVIADIVKSEQDVHPAEILQIFNRTIRNLLKQDTWDSDSDAGFDGGVLYFDKTRNLVRYAGAEMPLFYFQDGAVKIIKGDKHGVGYKRSDPEYVFTEYEFAIDEIDGLLVATDGYYDQNGGPKNFPLGKKRVKAMLEEHKNKAGDALKEAILKELASWQGSNERNDDVTVIGLKI